MVTHLCLHLLQLHLKWAEHQKGGRLRSVMVKIAQSSSKICSLEQHVSLVTLGINHEHLSITVKLPQIYTVKTENKHCLYEC